MKLYEILFVGNMEMLASEKLKLFPIGMRLSLNSGIQQHANLLEERNTQYAFININTDIRFYLWVMCRCSQAKS